MRALWIAAFLLVAGSTAQADDGLSELRAGLPNAPPAVAPVQPAVPDPMFRQDAKPAPAISGDADLALFFKRLEDLGFDTQELRALSRRLDVKFRAPGGDAYAEWGYILKNLYIPFEFKEKDTNKIRYDLSANEIDTMIHEFTHAARSLTASETAAKGTSAREHYEAVKVIWADLRSQSLLYRFAWMKADEVSGYFMGAAVSKVFEAVDEIVAYNAYLDGSKAASLEEARTLGGRLLIPTKETAKSGWSKGFLEQRYAGPFGRNSVYDSAMFKDNSFSSPALIHWKERNFNKDAMYHHILGLKPPKDIHDLLERLNKADNEWIRGVREKVAAARGKNAEKAKR